jgi:E3 ubiquitin-protein ligase HUWE1
MSHVLMTHVFHVVSQPTYHDMEAIDPDYYKNLQTILDYNLEDIDLDLTFSTETHSFGRSQTIDLIPSGRNVKVNESNKKEYVDLICQHRMTTAIEKQIKAYLDGFHEMIKPDLISVFNARELEMLISGMPDIDVTDLKKNTDYDGYKSSDKEIQWFWNILFSLSRSDKAAFVQFVTGSSKVPLGGFSQLQGMRGIQKFSIHKVVGTKGALMSAHTCFNSLDLPSYESEEEMKEKLLYAIHEGAEGFLFA